MNIQPFTSVKKPTEIENIKVDQHSQDKDQSPGEDASHPGMETITIKYRHWHGRNKL